SSSMTSSARLALRAGLMRRDSGDGIAVIRAAISRGRIGVLRQRSTRAIWRSDISQGRNVAPTPRDGVAGLGVAQTGDCAAHRGPVRELYCTLPPPARHDRQSRGVRRTGMSSNLPVESNRKSGETDALAKVEPAPGYATPPYVDEEQEAPD